MAGVTRPGLLRRLLGREDQSPHGPEAAGDPEPASPEAGGGGLVTPIGSAAPRALVTVRGRVATVEHDVRDSLRGLEVVVDDGTGRVHLVFMGRGQLPGIEPGRLLQASGRLTDAGGVATIHNPRYTLLLG